MQQNIHTHSDQKAKMPPKRRATNQPASQAAPKAAKKMTAANNNMPTADLKQQLEIAKEAFDEQDETIRHLNQEAQHHESIIRQQQGTISRLSRTPHTAAQDYAEVLAQANGRLHGQVAIFKERIAFLEEKLHQARMLEGDSC